MYPNYLSLHYSQRRNKDTFRQKLIACKGRYLRHGGYRALWKVCLCWPLHESKWSTLSRHLTFLWLLVHEVNSSCDTSCFMFFTN